MSSFDQPLTDEERSLLSGRADQFFDALARGNAEDWRPFLSGVDARVRPFLLSELIVIDMGHKWAAGERPTVEDYLDRFPELGTPDDAPKKLILEENLCRIKAGEVTDLEFFRTRFPKQFPAIQAELESCLQQHQTKISASVPALSSGPSSTGVSRAEARLSVSQQYEFVKELGRGMFGEVWLARKNPSGIEKAVKILLQPADRDAAKRELRSLELIKNLRHPYLLATEDFWVADNRLHVVMELADGTLRTRFKECRRQMLPGIPEFELLKYVQEAAEGLDYLHQMKITHRDVKPDNILLLHGHAKVADFGLARHQDAIMASMSFAGTPAYMAPEIWGGEGGPASDQYSLAFTYAELRQGKVPIPPKASMQEMMIAHLDGQFEFDGHLIAEPEQIVLRKAMARMPAERYPSCSAFVEELGRSLGHSFLRKPSKPVPVPPARDVKDAPKSTNEAMRLTSSGAHKPLGTVSDGSGSHKATRTTNTFSTTSQAQTGTKVGTGTITDRDKPTNQSKTMAPLRLKPKPKTPPSQTRVLLAAALTLVLVGMLAGMVYVIFVHPGGGGTTTTASEESGGKPQTTDKPIDPKPQPGTGRPPDMRNSNGSTKPTDNGKKPMVDPTPKPVLPNEQYFPVPDSNVEKLADGREVYRWIAYKLGDDEVRFRLLSRANAPTPPFYIMDSKVSAKLFSLHAAKAGSTFRPVPGADFTAPVFNVTAKEATDFARLFPGGRLPTPAEWDEAAGFADPQGLIKPSGQSHVKSLKPAPTGREHSKDVNHSDIYDMTGNGTEWTRGLLVPGMKPPVIDTEKELSGDPKQLVVIRGRRYTLSEPLSKEHLRYEQTVPQTQFAGTGNEFTSFRVVVPLPKI